MCVTLRVLYINITHPVGFLILILRQALLVCLVSWALIKSRWFSFIIFLIFLGGLIVLFVYITRLASNELIYSLQFESIPLIIITLAAPILFTLISNTESITIYSSSPEKTFFLIYSPRFAVLILFSMVYLLLTLIIVVKIADQFDAPIKTVN